MSSPIILLDRFAEFTRESTKDILLPTKPTPKTQSVTRPPEVWKMSLPDRDSETTKAPYVILQLLKTEDVQEEGEFQYGQCSIRVIAGVYSEKYDEGALGVVNILDRIREKLLRQRVIGDQFTLVLPLECIAIPSADTAPFFFGEMSTIWQIPTIKREVPEVWQENLSLPSRPQLRSIRENQPQVW